MKAITSFLAFALLLTCLAGNAEAQRKGKRKDTMKLSPPVKVGRADLGGVVSGLNGPEAGVWVIAETTGTPTQYAKVVVTDDKGRYMIPGLPKAKYRFSLLRVPEASEFPLGPVASQGQWLNTIKSGACQSCHALGTPGMRTVPAIFMEKGSSVEAWRERLKSGSAMALMARDIGRLDGERAIKLFAEWTDRIAAGELPFAQPERPKGIERNVVVTLWDWSQPTAYLHDAVSTDRRNPRVNANGKLYGSPEDSTDYVPVLDPKRNSADEVFHPVRDPETPSSKDNPFGPSVVWGPKPIWNSRTLNHNPMMDEKGRVWFTSRVRPNKNPDWCKGAEHPSAKAFPLAGEANRHLSMYDPRTGKWTLISTCFPTHHLNFARDTDQTLWTSSGVAGPGVVGWLNRRLYERTGDEVKSQGWTALVLDTNGNGKRDDYVQPDSPVDPAKDKRVGYALYAVAVSPADGTIWGTATGYPGAVIHVVPGADPANTALTEVYEPPAPIAFGPRGGDVDANGVYWVSLASGHLGSFDRRNCRVLNGPEATGKHCPEGWTLYAFPGPQLRDVRTPGSAEASYYVWVDRFGILGLGRNVPIAMGNLGDSIYALVEGRLLTFRLPYPSGLFPKNVDGRIDDPKAGWKGRALWTTSGTRTLFHNEGGKEMRHKAVRIQLRPDPLAR